MLGELKFAPQAAPETGKGFFTKTSLACICRALDAEPSSEFTAGGKGLTPRMCGIIGQSWNGALEVLDYSYVVGKKT